MQGWKPWVGVCAALLLVACGGSDDPPASSPSKPPAAKVVELVSADTVGNLRVSVQGAEGLQSGRYLAAADGQRLLLLVGEDGKVTTAMLRPESEADWMLGAGVERDGQITMSTQSDETSSAGALLTVVDMQASAGYEMLTAAGNTLRFAVDAQGNVQPLAGVNSCVWKGVVSASTLPQVLALQVEDNNGCLGAGATWRGVLLRDADDAPAVFRMLRTDGRTPAVDAWVFAR